jgi:GAF domain-containing protein
MAALPRKELADVLAEVARRLDAATDADAVLALITQLACEAIPGADHARITASERRGRDEAVGVAADGAVSQLELPLRAGGQSLGVLHVHSSSGSFDEAARRTAELFVTHAGIALAHARTEAQLHDALSTRTVIGQALGITMERYQLDEELALQLLTRLSQHTNVKLRDVARDVVAQATDQPRASADPVTAGA